MLEVIKIIGSIILVDLVLSGDNALTIGAALSCLVGRQFWIVLVVGGSGAIGLRIVFTLLVTVLLQVPLLKAIGGFLLVVVAVRLLMDRQKKPTEAGRKRSRARALLSVLATVLIADLSTSLDNMLAVGALADGNLLFLAVGLLLSIVCIFTVSAFIATLVARWSFLLDLAGLILGGTAAHMVLDDVRLQPLLVHVPLASITFPAFALISMLVVCGLSRRKPALA